MNTDQFVLGEYQNRIVVGHPIRYQNQDEHKLFIRSLIAEGSSIILCVDKSGLDEVRQFDFEGFSDIVSLHLLKSDDFDNSDSPFLLAKNEKWVVLESTAQWLDSLYENRPIETVSSFLIPGTLNLITGFSGGGKSTIVDLLDEKEYFVISMDAFGSIQNSKWIVDFAQVNNFMLTEMSKPGFNKTVVLEGVSDNFDELPVQVSEPVSIVIVPVPDASMFRVIMAGKANDYLDLNSEQADNVDLSWVEFWREKSTISDKEYDDYVDSMIAYYNGLFPGLVVPVRYVGTVEGWHQDR